MNIKQAIELCEEYGWEVTKGKYFLKSVEDNVIFNTDKELLDYAKMLEKERINN